MPPKPPGWEATKAEAHEARTRLPMRSAALMALAHTPEPKAKAALFTPPPAPSVQQQQRELDEDVRTAMQLNSVQMLSLSLLRSARSCSCSLHFDHCILEAVNHHHVAALEFLLTNGAKDAINETCGGLTALHRAVHKGDIGFQMAQLLLQHGANPNVVGSTGSTPLHDAALRGGVQAVQLLLEYQADPNARDANGRTALHLASQRTLFAAEISQVQVVQELLHHDADPTIADNMGMLPADVASTAVSSWGAAPTESSLCTMLNKAERWWIQRPVMNLRKRGQSGHFFNRLPEGVFEAFVRYL